MPYAVDPVIARFVVSGMAALPEGQPVPKIKVRVRLDLDSLLSVPSAQVVEELKSPEGAPEKMDVSEDVTEKDKEEENLDILGKNIFSLIPKKLDSTHNAILLSPVGVSVSLDSRHYYQLIMLLKNVHHLNIVHRDIRPENILLFEDNVLLIDWNAACFSSDMKYGGGTTHYASDKILRARINRNSYKVSACDDLHSVLRMAYVQTKKVEDNLKVVEKSHRSTQMVSNGVFKVKIMERYGCSCGNTQL